MEAWEVLERAADKIERDGWFSPHIPFCKGTDPLCASNAVAAVADAFTESTYHEGAHQALAKAVGGGSLPDIWGWNDAPGRTAEEVIAMLRACAASLKAARTEATRQHATESTVAEVATGDATALEHVS